jgi:hypothetical protein
MRHRRTAQKGVERTAGAGLHDVFSISLNIISLSVRNWPMPSARLIRRR